MPLVLFLNPSFKKCLNKLGADQKIIVAIILETLQIYYNFNCDLERARDNAPGFFYKQLRKPYYEAGVERNIRVVLEKNGSVCTAILAGNHDQIKKFLKIV